jgi:hypothetical protein
MQLGLDAWNGLGGRLEPSRASDVFVVANDVVGGFFALDSGRLGIGRGRLAYLAPDTMRWEDMDMGDSEFLQWLADGDLAGFAEGVGWRGVRHPDAPRGRRDLRRPAAVGGGAADLRAGSGADPHDGALDVRARHHAAARSRPPRIARAAQRIRPATPASEEHPRRRRGIGRAIADGYRRIPQWDEDVERATRAAIRSIEEEPW